MVFSTKKTANVQLLLFLTTNCHLLSVVVDKNVRLAAHLTGYRIDIKSASEYEAFEAERAEQAAAPAEEVAETAETEVVANDAE